MFSAQSFLEIEEGQFLSVLERHDFAVENYFGVEAFGIVRQLGKLLRHPPQIAREYFRARRAPMKLGANAVELVLDVDNLVCVVAGKPRPDRFCRRLRTGEHALDR